MKTKMKLHLIIYITIVGFLTACENEIPYNPGQQDPQIIMNALLETGQAENDVYLHLGEGYSIEHLNEATLFLYINGKIAETPKAVSPEEIYGHLEGELDKDIYESLLKSIRFKKYRLTSTLHPGDNIRLEATVGSQISDKTGLHRELLTLAEGVFTLCFGQYSVIHFHHLACSFVCLCFGIGKP